MCYLFNAHLNLEYDIPIFFLNQQFQQHANEKTFYSFISLIKFEPPNLHLLILFKGENIVVCFPY